jgi:surface protein
MKLIKKINSDINFLISLMFLFIFLSFPNLLFSRKVDSTEYKNEITLIIEGKGTQKILGESILVEPSQVIINGFTKQKIGYSNTYDLDNITNVVTIKWDTPLTTCNNMFFNFDNIISIDLSKFDSSKVSDMSLMFYDCTKLESINLENMNTSSLKDMKYMFYDCQSLKYIDLSYFDTSQVENMEFLFASCESLISINLSKFNTKSVQRMNSMFKNDKSLIYLDLSNFDIRNVETMDSMFNGCSSLVYINFNSFVENSTLKISSIFSYDINSLIYCIDANNSAQIYNYLKKKKLDNDCDNICFSESRKIIPEKKICIKKCEDDEIYRYEYKNICYDLEHYQEIIMIEKTEINKVIEYINISDYIELTDNFKKLNQQMKKK